MARPQSKQSTTARELEAEQISTGLRAFEFSRVVRPDRVPRTLQIPERSQLKIGLNKPEGKGFPHITLIKPY